jgi:hypothetical protein
MGLIDRLFGSSGPPDAPQTRMPTPIPVPAGADQNATRRELLRVVLRDTLARHGIPAAWIGSEVLATRGREPGVHLRLVLKHWEPRLLACTVALQKHIARRVGLYDPLAHNWLLGISWQFALADDSACPDMPDPTVWRVSSPAAGASAVSPQAARHADRKAELERMLGNNGKSRRSDKDQTDFGPTQPMLVERD